MKKIGIIDNFDSFVYNLVRYIKEQSNTEVIIQRNNAIDYAKLDECDALLLSPGPGIPSEAGELTRIIQRYSGKKKILGVCLGHQAIAEVFGGELIPCVEMVHGKSSILHVQKNDFLFFGLANSFPVGRYHSWQVSIPENTQLEITAETADGTIMALRHKTHPTKGIQFHPESILTPLGRQIITNWINE